MKNRTYRPLLHFHDSRLISYQILNRFEVFSRMIASTRPLATKFQPIYSSKGRWVGTMIPRKQVNEDGGDQAGNVSRREMLNRLLLSAGHRRCPPVLGSLVAISVLESLSKGDNKDD
ncbi:hypothetical protein SASPL_140823 [Salvia splendens]|uniref:Uncharacterized protein n=1 Tax=Salvia splendens TaxID=180675 RepID=A0A8X8WSY1_SALSN|nr:hypothetical protein SASPL_140823 [Salvia splendens]